MTTEETVERIEGAIAHLLDITDGDGTAFVSQVTMNALPEAVFDVLSDRYGASDTVAEKCSCGNCGNVVLAQICLISDEAGENVAKLIIARSATSEETAQYLEAALAIEG